MFEGFVVSPWSPAEHNEAPEDGRHLQKLQVAWEAYLARQCWELLGNFEVSHGFCVVFFSG